MRLAWMTDIHLNFLSPSELSRFSGALADSSADAFVITGDIAEAHNVERLLGVLAQGVERPVYFVLGNHDYYRGSINEVRGRMRALSEGDPYLRWLPSSGVVALGVGAALIGHGGWGDGRIGDFGASPIDLNDYHIIRELSGLPRGLLLERLNELGDEAALHLSELLHEALDHAERVVLATHVPPWRQACWHQGKLSDDDWAPHFTCKAVGDVLVKIMSAHPEQQLTVLCGHTHSPGEADILPNVRVYTGGAMYGAPKLQRVLEL